MTTQRFHDLPEEEQEWVDAYLNETIDPESFDQLQERMAASPELRAAMRRYLALDNSLQNELGEAAANWSPGPAEDRSNVLPLRRGTKGPRFWPMAAAAGLAFLCGLIVMQGFRRAGGTPDVSGRAGQSEPSAEGFAVVAQTFDVKWPQGSAAHVEGDSLGAELFALQSGTAEIRFFSGATMTVEGPAEIMLKSAWEAECREGAVRMQVPPAARGFKLRSPGSEIVDLGTEFGLEVRGGQARVEVFDGEIALRHRDEQERLVTEGAAWDLPEAGAAVPGELGAREYPDPARLGSQAAAQRLSSFTRWESHRDQLVQDPRLIAYYTFDGDPSGGLVPDLAAPQSSERDGTVVLAEPVAGRWPGSKGAVEFRRPGARVRVNLPGEFPAFTFICWVRIDSLDRWYNALFMADSYETGEPHWQIRDDGKMMVSVMVDDSRRNPKNRDGPPTAFHRLYYSPPMWDPSMSGRWLHLASVFDPANQRVSHYVNGERISREAIKPQHMINRLRIGNAEIGNWGQPLREDPTFAIRNLNGRMDEIAIFQAALDDAEIGQLYQQSRADLR